MIINLLNICRITIENRVKGTALEYCRIITESDQERMESSLCLLSSHRVSKKISIKRDISLYDVCILLAFEHLLIQQQSLCLSVLHRHGSKTFSKPQIMDTLS